MANVAKKPREAITRPASERSIVLVSSDRKEFVCPIKVARMSSTIRGLLDDLGFDENSEVHGEHIPLATIDGNILELILKWCEHHKADPQPDPNAGIDTKNFKVDEANQIVVDDWDKQFMKILDQSTIMGVIEAANFLHITRLLELCCKTIANMVRGKTPREIRGTFNITDDHDPETKARLRRMELEVLKPLDLSKRKEDGRPHELPKKGKKKGCPCGINPPPPPESESEESEESN